MTLSSLSLARYMTVCIHSDADSEDPPDPIDDSEQEEAD